jgi:hypothetical protein
MILYTLDEVAEKIRKSRRCPREWLRGFLWEPSTVLFCRVKLFRVDARAGG